MVARWAVLALLLVVAQSSAMTIELDYTYDTTGFFTDNPAARNTLEAVAQVFSQNISDTLSALIPQGANSWELRFTRPDTGVNDLWVDNPTIAADTLVVYVGARNIGGTTLAQGGPGGWSASGYQSWFDLINSRGESNTTGPSATDFAPWGGALSFDDDAGGYGWHFDYNTPVVAGKADLYTTAAHELAHILGFGTANSWDSRVVASGDGYVFTGPVAVAAYGDAVPLDSSQHHWQQGVTSPVNGHYQSAVLTPVIRLGTREYFTLLDWGGLDDVGWDVAAPPAVLGDLNADLLVNALDINPFVSRLTTGAYLAAADMNMDGAVNALDISGFVAALTGAGATAVPEPAAGLALGPALWAVGRRGRTRGVAVA